MGAGRQAAPPHPFQTAPTPTRTRNSSHSLIELFEQRETARRAAEAAGRARVDFLATMSHEIRTPMTSVLGMADLLAAEPLSDKQRHFVDAIRSSGRHLRDLINDVLDLSRIESDKLELEY